MADRSVINKSDRYTTDYVSSIAFCPNPETSHPLLSGSYDENLRIWDVRTGECANIFTTDRLYEGTIVQGVTGLTKAQQIVLRELGALA